MKERKAGPSTFSRKTLWKVIRKMGYRCKALDRRIYLTEQLNIKVWRRRLIQRLNQNAQCQTPKPVIYIDESWIGCNAVALKGWVPKIMKNTREKMDHTFAMKTGRGPRLIMVHAGTITVI